MRLVLLGPPGAGKGSLAGILKKSYNLVHISTGDMLREEIQNNTIFGQEIKDQISKGALVPDELVTKLVNQRIRVPDILNRFVLDGFPRTVKQAQDLDEILAQLRSPLDVVLDLAVNFDILLKRLTGRRVCRKCGALYHTTNKPPQREGICDVCGGELYQRTDDNEATIKERMFVYQENTAPIIDYYTKRGKLKKLDANVETADLCKSLLGIIR